MQKRTIMCPRSASPVTIRLVPQPEAAPRLVVAECSAVPPGSQVDCGQPCATLMANGITLIWQ